MSYIPDCRTDADYNEKFLGHDDKEFVRGYDWCAEHPVTNAFDNLERWEHEGLDVRPSDIEKVLEAFKPFLLDWIERDRNDLITSMIDSMDEDEYQKRKAETPIDNGGQESPGCSGLFHGTQGKLAESAENQKGQE